MKLRIFSRTFNVVENSVVEDNEKVAGYILGRGYIVEEKSDGSIVITNRLDDLHRNPNTILLLPGSPPVQTHEGYSVQNLAEPQEGSPEVNFPYRFLDPYNLPL